MIGQLPLRSSSQPCKENLPMRSIRTLTGLAFSTLMLSAPSAFAKPGDGYIWEYTSSMQMSGMNMPMPAVKRCQLAGTSEKTPPMQGKCTVSNLQTNGNTTSFEMSCPPPDEMKGKGSSTVTETTMDAEWTFSSADGEMAMKMHGERKEACDTAAPQPGMPGMPPGMAPPR
jgi:hypothetical protein